MKLLDYWFHRVTFEQIIGVVCGIAVVLIVIWLFSGCAMKANGQQTSELTMYHVLTNTDYMVKQVYILCDTKTNCQYIVVVTGTGATITPRLVRPVDTDVIR